MISKKDTQNKAISRKDVEIKTLQEFFFPDYSLTIQAENKEEAEKKLLEIINKK
jgi:translation initiation factor 2 alpha subunit (eIF-2alpha)